MKKLNVSRFIGIICGGLAFFVVILLSSPYHWDYLVETIIFRQPFPNILCLFGVLLFICAYGLSLEDTL